jgi:hypothetical protein
VAEHLRRILPRVLVGSHRVGRRHRFGVGDRGKLKTIPNRQEPELRRTAWWWTVCVSGDDCARLAYRRSVFRTAPGVRRPRSPARAGGELPPLHCVTHVPEVRGPQASCRAKEATRRFPAPRRHARLPGALVPFSRYSFTDSFTLMDVTPKARMISLCLA